MALKIHRNQELDDSHAYRGICLPILVLLVALEQHQLILWLLPMNQVFLSMPCWLQLLRQLSYRRLGNCICKLVLLVLVLSKHLIHRLLHFQAISGSLKQLDRLLQFSPKALSQRQV